MLIVSRGAVLTELEMWSVFHCLARGALVMAHGSEDTSRLPWNKDIVHFDLKPQNSKSMPFYQSGDRRCSSISFIRRSNIR